MKALLFGAFFSYTVCIKKTLSFKFKLSITYCSNLIALTASN